MTQVSSTLEWRSTDDGLTPIVLTGKTETAVGWAAQAGGQVAALSCPVHEAIFEGNRGASKTDTLLMCFAQHCGKGYGQEWRGIIFRRTYKELKDLITKSRKWIPRIFPKAVFNETAMSWTWPDREQLLLSYFRVPADYDTYHGHAYPFIGWEELTRWPDDKCYKPMFSCSRSTVPGMPRMIRSTTNPYGCVRHGEVLTERGWVPIQDFKDGLLVLTHEGFRPATLVQHDYNGTIITRNGAGLRMEFTDDHRLPHLNTGHSAFTLRAFHDLPGQASVQRTLPDWSGESPPTLHGFDAGDFMELMGWVLSEGCCIRRDRAVQIAQNKPEGRERIQALLDRMQIHYRSDRQAFVLSGVYPIFEEQGYSYEKFVPRPLLNLSRPLLSRLLESLMLGDGSDRTYYTISPQLADDVQEIGVRLGKSVFTRSRKRVDRKWPTFEVRLSNRSNVQLNTGNHVYDVKTSCNSVNVMREGFRGQVYCLNVPGPETFFLRQDGCVWMSGNSGHNWVKNRFRLPITRTRGPVIRDSLDMEGEPEPERVAIHFDLMENKVLLAAQPNYLQDVKAAARNQSEYDAWVYGSWDIVAGGMFDDVWNPKIHMVPNFPPSNIPAGWHIDRSYDHGQSHPFSVGWWAESNGEPLHYNGHTYGALHGDLIRFAEWYGWTGEENVGLNLTAREIAVGIIERERDMGIAGRVRPGPADRNIYTKDQSGTQSTASDMAAMGVRWVEADQSAGSRKQGWEQIRTLLKSALTYPREFPAMYATERCEQFKRIIPSLPRKELDLDDVPKEAEDHLGDETRYRACFKRKTITMGDF